MLRGRLFLIIGLIIVAVPDAVVGDGLRRDQEVLLNLKEFLLKKNRLHAGNYAQWNASDPSPCNWTGITCHNGRVSEIDLRESSISGEFFDGFSDLTELSRLDLSTNTLCGSLPISLTKCGSLKHLNLSRNIIGGSLNLSGPYKLEVLDISLNRFNGSIQSDLGEFCGNLVVFNISTNRFSGEISDLFDRCPKLKYLDLSSNRFSGTIWPGFSNLIEFSASGNGITGVLKGKIFPENCSLSSLDLSQNLLTGAFPETISNCRNLKNLDLWGNRFSGEIPSSIGSLPQLEYLFLGNNTFDRRIPEQLLNCAKLAVLDLSKNNFGGEIQPIFGRFTQVESLTLHGNNYNGGLQTSGILNLKNIARLDLSLNSFSGSLPPEIATMPRLRILILAHNNFSGVIPSSFGDIITLQLLDLSHNKLSGEIPSSLGKLSSLLWLTIADNSLTGRIPPEMGGCRSLLWLNLADNNLSGGIPKDIAKMGSSPEETFRLNRRGGAVAASTGECLAFSRWLPADYPPFSFFNALMDRRQCRRYWTDLLTGQGILPICLNRSSTVRTLAVTGYLQLAGNELSGEIPAEMGRMKWLSVIHLNRNSLIGRLPAEIGLVPLIVLNLSRNLLSGEIPATVGEIRCLQSLDLSCNNFSGEIPQTLNRLSQLSLFNVSFNYLLGGVIPKTGPLSTFDESSFLGDPLIVLGRRVSSPGPAAADGGGGGGGRRGEEAFWIFFSLSAFLFFVGFVILAWFSGCRRSADVENPTVVKAAGVEDESLILLDKAVSFGYEDIAAATGGFAEEMVIGRGGFGVVYRGVLPDGRRVAVKRLQREGAEGEREFQAEMEVLSRQPHPNLVALYGWCLVGAQRLLVYEYMPGGTLEGVVSDWARFGWRRRLGAASDVARALVFLHHECVPAVVHRDVKASNVLLDGAGRARVTDFGLARVVRPGDSHVSTAIAGTVGYVAPEYGQRWQATTKGDVYSFGVLAMELAAGRAALDGGEDCLVDLVRLASQRGRAGAARLAGGGSREGRDAMTKLLAIGLRCAEEAPQARPTMEEVHEALLLIHPAAAASPPSPVSSRPDRRPFSGHRTV
ncbi:leucine-rich repeat protein kinase family protein [Wolffia australiana]